MSQEVKFSLKKSIKTAELGVKEKDLFNVAILERRTKKPETPPVHPRGPEVRLNYIWREGMCS